MSAQLDSLDVHCRVEATPDKDAARHSHFIYHIFSFPKNYCGFFFAKDPGSSLTGSSQSDTNFEAHQELVIYAAFMQPCSLDTAFTNFVSTDEALGD